MVPTLGAVLWNGLSHDLGENLVARVHDNAREPRRNIVFHSAVSPPMEQAQPPLWSGFFSLGAAAIGVFSIRFVSYG